MSRSPTSWAGHQRHEQITNVMSWSPMSWAGHQCHEQVTNVMSRSPMSWAGHQHHELGISGRIVLFMFWLPCQGGKLPRLKVRKQGQGLKRPHSPPLGRGGGSQAAASFVLHMNLLLKRVSCSFLSDTWYGFLTLHMDRRPTVMPKPCNYCQLLYHYRCLWPLTKYISQQLSNWFLGWWFVFF